MATKTKTAKRSTTDTGNGKGENISGYFRQIFAEQPRLLRNGSNNELYERWLADHPGVRVVPENVKQGLSNVKTVLRNKKRKKKPMDQGMTTAPPKPRAKLSNAQLERLETQIDDCLALASSFGHEGLQSVTNLMRRARHEVVWMMGQ
jgi:hypothetical protein